MSMSKKRVPLKALLLLLIFSLGSLAVSGTVVGFPITDAHRTPGTFLVTVSPASIMIPQGTNATSKITITSDQGFSGTVSLVSQVASGSVTVTFNPSRVNVPVGGSATSIVTVQAAKNASMGTYTIILTGTSVVGKKVLASSVLLIATVSSQADFRVYAYPYSITVVAGFSNSTSIILQSNNGFNGTVTLTALVPFGFLGAMGGQNPVTLTPGATSSTSLQVSTTTSTLLGKYNITITGSSGSVNHSCVLTVNVVDPAPESLTLSGFSNNSPTSLTLTLRNNGNTPIVLQSYSIADISGDKWMLANWTGPTISPGASNTALIVIGSSCSSCTYNGITGLFQQFLTGHTYVITLTTKFNNQFTYTIVA